MELPRKKLSIIIPAKNEAKGLMAFLPQLRQAYPFAEIIVINDGSTDDTAEVAQALGAKVISHPLSLGNGAAIKTGARAAKGDTLLFMDGDDQHQVDDIPKLFAKYQEGYDMVVGARDSTSQASFLRLLGNSFYNFLASFIVGRKVLDLTSGFRLVNAQKFKEFIYLLPNGFSSPTTITLAFFRSGFSVAYQPIHAKQRIGKSHLRPFSDGIRFLLILYKMTILYSPIKVFLPFALLHVLAGLANYVYTYISYGRFTNMSAMLFSAAVIIFLIGLLSEQMTTLMYAQGKVLSQEKLRLKKPKGKKQRKKALPYPVAPRFLHKGKGGQRSIP